MEQVVSATAFFQKDRASFTMQTLQGQVQAQNGDVAVGSMALWRQARKRQVVVDVRGPLVETEMIRTLEGTMRAGAGDYVVRGVRGELYPVKPGIFAETYEFVEE